MFLSQLIKNLNKDLSDLGENVLAIFQKTIRAVKDQDIKLAQKVRDKDIEIDEMEVSIEESCLEILALHNPVAKDLRKIIAVLKINNDLERVGDLAGNISYRVSRMHEANISYKDLYFDFDAMSEKTYQMLQNALTSFFDKSIGQAKAVLSQDDEVDNFQIELFKKLHSQQGSSLQLENYVLSLSIAKFLERIADHATNIAEDTIYTLKGKIVRHGEKK